MTAELLLALLRANLAGGAAILAVLALRRPTRRLFGARVAYGLWALVPLAALAVLLPARTEAPAGPIGLIAPAAASIAPTAASPTALATKATKIQPSHASASPPQLRPAPSPAPILDVIAAVWLIGVAAGLVVLGWRQRRFLSALGRLSPDERGRKVLVAEFAGIGPAVVGCFAPRIVLPSDFEQRFSGEERAVVLAHETAHLTRQDARANGLVALAQCVNWFNPMVHVAAHLARIDQELACDEEVMARQPGARRRYAEALLKTQLSVTPLPLGCYWPARARHPLEARIARLKTPAPAKSRRLAGALAVAAICLAGGVAAWASQPPRAEPAADGLGDWLGQIDGPSEHIAVHLHRSAQGGYAVSVDIPDYDAYGAQADKVRFEGGQLSFAVPTISAAFEGTWDPAHRDWDGTWFHHGVGAWYHDDRKWPLRLSAAIYPLTPKLPQLDGDWSGNTGGPASLRIVFHIHTDANGTTGTYDSPDQDIVGAPLSGLSHDNGFVMLRAMPLNLFFMGQLRPDGAISGSLDQNGVFSGRFELKRSAGVRTATSAVPARALPTPVAVDPQRLAAYAGVYDLSDAGTPEMVVTAANGHLYARMTNPGMGVIMDQPAVEITPASQTSFYWKNIAVEADFAAPVNGHSPYAVIHALGHYQVAQRVGS